MLKFNGLKEKFPCVINAPKKVSNGKVGISGKSSPKRPWIRLGAWGTLAGVVLCGIGRPIQALHADQ